MTKKQKWHRERHSLLYYLYIESKNYNKLVNKTNEKADSQGKNKFHLRGKSKRGKNVQYWHTYEYS